MTLINSLQNTNKYMLAQEKHIAPNVLVQIILWLLLFICE